MYEYLKSKEEMVMESYPVNVAFLAGMFTEYNIWEVDGVTDLFLEEHNVKTLEELMEIKIVIIVEQKIIHQVMRETKILIYGK